MLTLLLAALPAVAAPPGYKVSVAAHDGCELSLGPPAADGVVPMHAACDWPDATLERFRAVMADWAAHAEVFGVIVRSEVRKPGARALVYQLQRTKGISDREVLMWMWHEVVAGADRYAWTTAAEEPLALGSGTVRPARTDGYWQAEARPAGGIHVVHHLEYDPGGYVPGFVVRAFQVDGLKTNVGEVHAALR